MALLGISALVERLGTDALPQRFDLFILVRKLGLSSRHSPPKNMILEYKVHLSVK